ncbi:MAG TPA: apolipoprotein N-acyltransferase [Plasticicumulans sp.]|nr:apolipoprotein N-acyltransferase [Plasticicumulans sp.]
MTAPLADPAASPSAVSAGSTDSGAPAAGRLAAGHPLALLLAPIAGLLLPLAFAPYRLWPLGLLLPAVLLWLIDGERPRRALLIGLLFGLGSYGHGIWWIYISLHRYGGAPPAFAGLATFLVVLLMAAYVALFAGLLNRLAPAPGARRWLLAAPGLWALLEWVRSWAFTGFPWLALGYAQVESPLAGLAPILGTFGLGALVMLVAGSLRLALARLRSGARAALAPLAVALLVPALGFGLGRIDWSAPAGRVLAVGLAQGNIAQEMKWRPGKLEETIAVYAGLSQRAQAQGHRDLIVWPETALPAFLSDLDDNFLAELRAWAAETGTDLLIGAPDGDRARRDYRNAVASIGRTPGVYAKHRLLPFGEYLPLRGLLMIFRDFVQIPMADFTAGAADQPLLVAAGVPVGVSICFESVFGSEVRRALPAAQLLVVVSNDAWFGDSLAPHQHLQIAQMRALEAARPLVRATNTGLTAIVDERGRITAQAPAFVETVLDGDVQPRSGVTPYVRFGDGPAAGLAAVLLLAGALRRRG